MAVNENRKGYKKTKLGWIPEDWETKKIDSLFTRIRKSVKVEPDEIYEEIGIRSHGKGLFHKEPVTGEKIGNKSVFWIETNCLVLNIVFAWEQAVAKTTDLEKGKIASHRFPMYKAKPQITDLDYVLYFFKSPIGKHSLGLASPGGAGRNKTLGQGEFSKLKIPYPPYPEQQKIAKILTTWDKAIELTQELIQAKTRRKKGLMQQLLTGKKRFEEFRKKSWKKDKLGNNALIKRGASPRPITDPKYFATQGRGWIRISDVTSTNMYIKSASQYLSDLGASKSVAVNKGDFIMSICATIGVPRIVDFPACIHDGFVLISNFSKVLDKYFLYHYISYITEKLSNSGQPGTQKNLNTTIVGNIEIPKITLKEQTKIAAVLTACDKEIDLLNQKLEALKQQKKGLMQKLLTGQIRPSTSSGHDKND
ncbi:restriction endonuclease subunit S [Desulfobacterales bacterium HSG2]|nr:restriction endonuclease subunit S [Desulfobacterales bacterium HSG2]